MTTTEEQDVYRWIEDRFPYDGPHSRDTVIEAALVLSRLVRYLNNATQPGIARHTLEWAHTVDQIVGNMAGAAYGQNQLLEQLALSLTQQASNDPTLYDDRREDAHPGAVTANDAATALMQAVDTADQLGASLDRVCGYTTHLGNN
jgi:hypothetical protein